MELGREDYTEPRCPFETDQWKSEPPVRSIPVSRIIEKLDELYSRNDFDAAVRLIDYWMEEAKSGRDLKGEFSLRNELMGIYRKTGKRTEAVENARLCIDLVEKIDARGSISEGTALVNAATVCKAFDRPEESLALFRRARDIYEANLKPGDWRLGGLYNNMGLTLADLGRFAEARMLFNKALSSMALVEGSQAEQAVTCLNMADLACAEKGLEAAEQEIAELCAKAAELLESEELPRDGQYAFYCEKCAPVFSYYGFFMDAEKFSERARQIYERP